MNNSKYSINVCDASDSLLVSALQKEVRRCNRDNARQYASELLRRCDLGGTNDIQRWLRLWRRLLIISTEDIGVAVKGVLPYLKRTWLQADQHLKEHREIDACRLFMQAVLTLASNNKSRLTDHAYILFTRWQPNTLEEYQSCAQRFWSSNNDERTLLQSIALIFKSTHVSYVSQEQVWQSLFGWVSDNDSAVVEMRALHQAWRADPCPLYAMHAALLVVRRTPKDFVRVSSPSTEEMKKLLSGDAEKEARAHTIPDYCIDQHTKEGRSMGRGFEHFIRVGCVLQQCVIADPYVVEIQDRLDG